MRMTNDGGSLDEVACPVQQPTLYHLAHSVACERIRDVEVARRYIHAGVTAAKACRILDGTIERHEAIEIPRRRRVENELLRILPRPISAIEYFERLSGWTDIPLVQGNLEKLGALALYLAKL